MPTTPCEMATVSRLASSSAEALFRRTMRTSLTALETVVSIRSIRERISAMSAGAAWTNTVFELSSCVTRIWCWAAVSLGKRVA